MLGTGSTGSVGYLTVARTATRSFTRHLPDHAIGIECRESSSRRKKKIDLNGLIDVLGDEILT